MNILVVAKCHVITFLSVFQLINIDYIYLL